MSRIFEYCLLYLCCLLVCGTENLQEENNYSWDENGYVFFCLCMGRFGNQADHFLGSVAFAKALNRTLVVPTWMTYKGITFTDWFQLKPLQDYHRVILAEDFMKILAPKYWPKGQRKGYCWLPHGSNQKCIMKEGFPFKAFWDGLGIDFDDFVVHHVDYNTEDPYILSEWMNNFPPSKHPVLAFRGAPATFPILPQHKSLQKLLKWSSKIESIADDYIEEKLRPGKFLGIHLRNEHAWVKSCDYADGAATFMASPQCLGQSRYRKVTKELCAPPRDEILRATKQKIEEIQAQSLFIATDNDPMLNDFRKIFDPLNVTVRYLNPERPQVDLAILGKADYFIGNCVSSFTAFVKRERDMAEKASTFWAFKS